MKQSMRHKLDLRGAIIPFTLLKVSQVFRNIPPGDTLEVYWSDPDTPADLFKILPESSYDMISMDVMKEDPCYRMEILKKSADF